ncbi:hypothetical protein ACTQ33_12755 [Candidatus Avoscillospira sp. LCP25S3_F1]|uniref:hypothetical protein n=1 Tax=Candidatus Avoscillospira sp. LCP25S3_F1 TaxID=3438825 RepID=UPI003F8FC4CC
MSSFFEHTRKPRGLGGKLMVTLMNAGHRPLARWGLSHLQLVDHSTVLDKTTPRLIQFHILKNAVNPPFLGGFLFSAQ